MSVYSLTHQSFKLLDAVAVSLASLFVTDYRFILPPTAARPLDAGPPAISTAQGEYKKESW